MTKDDKLASYLWEYELAIKQLIPLYMKCMECEYLEEMLDYCKNLERENKLHTPSFKSYKDTILELNTVVSRLKIRIEERQSAQ